jgi:hypothetical protein
MKKILKSRYAHWLAIALITLLFMFIRSDGNYSLLPFANYDDALQFNLAQNITSGHWLGKYNELTLAKEPAYPIWLAAMHSLDIPLWFAQISLYAFACLALAFAVRSLFRNRWLLPVVYAILLFSPILSIRVYRDAIAPSLLILILAWTIGVLALLLNKTYPVGIRKRDFCIYTAFGAAALPAWWYLREDSFWIVPFLVVFYLAAIIGIIRGEKDKVKALLYKKGRIQLLVLLVPIVMLNVTGVVLATINWHSYGRFVVNDYTSPEFEAAYGSLTRIHDPNWQPTVPVSESMRQDAYKVSPLFAKLKPCLDNNGKGKCEGFKLMHIQINNDDYEGGWFFWSLRGAVREAGYYKNPDSAKKYYTQLAKQINGACERKVITCDYGKRASLAPPFRKGIVPLTVKDLDPTFQYLVTYPDAVNLQHKGGESFDPGKQQMADYYDVRYRADELNFAIGVKLKIQQSAARLYQVTGVGAFVLSVLALVVMTVLIIVRKSREILGVKAVILTAVAWSLLVMLIIPRLIMLAYVSASSFPAANYLYFGSLFAVSIMFECFAMGVFLDALLTGRFTKILSVKNGSSKSKVRA